MASTITVQTTSDDDVPGKTSNRRKIYLNCYVGMGAVRSDVQFLAVPAGYVFLLKSVTMFTSLTTTLPLIIYDGTANKVTLPTPASGVFSPTVNLPDVPFYTEMRYASGDQEISKDGYFFLTGELVPMLIPLIGG